MSKDEYNKITELLIKEKKYNDLIVGLINANNNEIRGSIPMITSKQRAYLRGLANELPAIMQVGKGGVNENMLKTFSDALEARELIKLHVLENSGYTPKEMIAALAEALDAEAVAVTGKKIVLYRASEKKPVIELPRA